MYIYSEGWNNLKVDDGTNILFDIDKKESTVKMNKIDIKQLSINNQAIDLLSLLGQMTVMQQEISALKQKVVQLEMKNDELEQRKELTFVTSNVTAMKQIVYCPMNTTAVLCSDARSNGHIYLFDDRCECSSTSTRAVCNKNNMNLKLFYI